MAIASICYRVASLIVGGMPAHGIRGRWIIADTMPLDNRDDSAISSAIASACNGYDMAMVATRTQLFTDMQHVCNIVSSGIVIIA